jgi:RNA polymerase sigma-70 factor (ECF subfamily)
VLTTAPTDEALLELVAAGDQEATSVLVRRYERRVYGLALAVLGDPHRAQEAAQEAIERVYRRAASFEPSRGSAAGWILTIARNAAIDERRRTTGAQQAVALDGLELSSQGPDPLDQAITNESLTAIRSKLAGLPEGQRRALVLAAWGGLTAAEIAEREQVPLGTAKTRLRSGLLNLRSALDGPNSPLPPASHQPAVAFGLAGATHAYAARIEEGA